LRPFAQQALHGRDEIDMRTRQDIDPARLAPQDTMQIRRPPLLSAQLRVEVAGMHDAEHSVMSRGSPPREVSGIEAVRYRHDRLRTQLGKRSAQLRHRLV